MYQRTCHHLTFVGEWVESRQEVFSLLICHAYITLFRGFYVLTSDDSKTDIEIVQRRPIRISLRGNRRHKELNNSLSNMNRLLSFNFSSSRLILLEGTVSQSRFCCF